MRKRAVKELYGIAETKIAAVLEGSCRIQGAEEELDSDICPAEKQFNFADKSINMGVESGTCNVCYAPCSSCLHNNRSMSGMESKMDCGSSGNPCAKKASHGRSFIGTDVMPLKESSICDDSLHAASETSKVLSSSSSHDSYSDNAQSKVTQPASLKCEITYDFKSKGDDSFSSKNIPNICYKMSPSQDKDKDGLEFNENSISCITGTGDSNIGVDHRYEGLGKKNVLLVKDIENGSTSEATDGFHASASGERQSNCMKQIVCLKESSQKFADSAICAKKPEKMDNKISSSKVMKSSIINKKIEVPGSLVVEGGNSESDTELLTDVNVCDICGDTGREDLLAVCSRCSDGAEHIYCMRVKLRKVPGGDWLCEECQLVEDAERKKADRTEKVCNPKEDAVVKKIPGSDKGPGPSNVCKIEENEHKQVAKEEAEVKKIQRFEKGPGPSKVCKIEENTEHKQAAKEEAKVKKIPRSEKGPEPSKVCKIEENTEHKQVPKSPKLSRPLEINRNFERTSSMKRKSDLDTKAIDPKERKVSEGLQKPGVSTKSHLNSQELMSVNIKRPLETSGEPNEIGSPRKKIALSHASSFKNLRAPNMLAPNRDQKANNSQALSRSQSTLDFNSPKTHSQVRQPVGFIQRSRSFNNSNLKPKVKQLTESVPVKRKMVRKSSMDDTRKELIIPVKSRLNRESSLNDARKDSTVKSLGKSTSFKGSMPDRPNTGSSSRTQFVDQSPINSPRAGSSRPHPKVDMKTAVHDIKSNTMSESDTFRKNKGSDNANGSEMNDVMKMSTYSSKINGRASLNANCDNQEHRPCRDGHGSAGSVKKSCDKTKEYNISTDSRQAVSSENQTVRCQKCNRTGHATESCSIGKGTSKDAIKKGSKWKAALRATISKNRLPKTDGKSGLLEKFSSSKDIPLVVAKSDGQEILRSPDMGPVKTTPVADVDLNAFQQVEASYTPQGSDLTTTSAGSDEQIRKPLSYINPFSSTSIPELKSIWQGCLKVLSVGNEPILFDGIQAHMSTSAAPEVLEISMKLPCRVQLEEVSCYSSWRLQSRGIRPNEENVDIFFFAKDVESYERSYSKLLEKMLINDLVLGGIIDGVKLLIFPSNKLPLHSQRWNRLFFLWGVFRERMTDDITAGPAIDTNPSVVGLPCSLTSAVSNSQSIEPVGSTDKKSPDFDDKICITQEYPLFRGRMIDDSTSGPTIDINPSVLELPCSLSSAVSDSQSIVPVESTNKKSPEFDDKICRAQEYPCIRNTSSQSDAKSKLLFDLNTTDQLPDFLGPHPESKFEMINTQSCSELKNEDTCLINLGDDSGGRHVVAPPTHFPATYQHLGCSRASVSPSTSDQIKCMDIRSGSANGIGIQVLSMESEGVFFDDPQLSWEERSNNKRANVIKNSGETMTCMDEDRELKRLRYGESPYGEGHTSTSYGEEDLTARLSAKLQPLFPSFLSDQHRASKDDANLKTVTLATSNSRGVAAERFFFPAEPAPLITPKLDNFVDIISSDDEETPKSNTSNLKLGLASPSPRDLSLKKLLDDGDANLSILSLSLGRPTPQPHFKDRPDINTSLYLFS